MSTKKIYNKNTYIKEFTANINKITEKNKEFHLQLDQTAFYPEGGGQPSDQGLIDEVPVKYVYEEDNSIYHVLDRLPSKLDNVKCTIDWERRFDHMQQHLGQHILSAAFEKLHDAQTIGFHLGNEYVTIDINQILSESDIINVEFLANQIVFNDLQVEILYPTVEELNELPLRKSPSVSENIRIVKINDFDYSPCGGTHPNRTGEVGLIKIRKWENYKDGIRVEFICGNRSLQDYIMKNNIINKASALLSVKDKEVASGIERVYDELATVKKENKYYKDQLMEVEVNKLVDSSEKENNVSIIIKTFDNRDFGELRQLASMITNSANAAVILGNIMDDKAQVILSRSKSLNSLNMKNIFNEVIPILDGKGGGNQFTAQGGGKNIEALNQVVEMSYELIKSNIG